MMIKENSAAPEPRTASGPAPASHLYAYTVEEYDAGNGRTARSWTRIGVAFPHRDGTGFNLELRALPLDGRIVVLPPNDDAHGRGEAAEPSDALAAHRGNADRDNW